MPSVNQESPTGGLNTRDSLDSMPPNDATHLVNWVPESGFVRSRKGWVPYVNLLGLGEPIETLASYEDGAGRVMFACSGGNIYNVTDPNTPVLLHNGANSDRWNVQQFNSRLIFMNEDVLDEVLVFTGSTGLITPLVVTTGPAGNTSNPLFTGSTFKGRMVYAEIGTESMWYSEAGSFQGDLTEFPVGTVTQRGGNIEHILTWSRDAGNGMDDYLCIMLDTGETLVYQGDDPGDVLGWELTQAYMLPDPVNAKRTFTRMASKTVIITDDGYLNFEDALGGSVNDYSTMSSKIARTVKNALVLYGENYGWQVVFHPKGNYLLINVPIVEGEQFEQHVMNTRNGNWTVFNGWNSNCWVVHGDELYFADSDGNIRLADFGHADGGKNITCEAVMAWNKYDVTDKKKLYTAITIITNHRQPWTISMQAAGDYKRVVIPDVALPSGQEEGAFWDVAEWDEEYWAESGDVDVIEDARPIRRPLSADGFALTFAVRSTSAIQQVYWYSQTLEFSVTGIK